MALRRRLKIGQPHWTIAIRIAIEIVPMRCSLLSLLLLPLVQLRVVSKSRGDAGVDVELVGIVVLDKPWRPIPRLSNGSPLDERSEHGLREDPAVPSDIPVIQGNFLLSLLQKHHIPRLRRHFGAVGHYPWAKGSLVPDQPSDSLRSVSRDHDFLARVEVILELVEDLINHIV